MEKCRRLDYYKLDVMNEIEYEYVDEIEVKPGRGSQNFLKQIRNFFATLRCFYEVIIRRK